MTKTEFDEWKYACPVFQSVYANACSIKNANCHFDLCPFMYWINKNEELIQNKIEKGERE